MTLKLWELAELLDAEIVVGKDKRDMPFEFCTASDLMSDVLRGPVTGSVLLTGLNNTQVIRASVIANIDAIIVVRRKEPNQDLVKQAEDYGIPLLQSPLTMFTACGRLYNAGVKGIDDLLSHK